MPSSIANSESGLSARTKINEGFVDITHGGADNALLKADGADATLQSSGIICDDSDNLSGLGTILPVSDEAKDMGSTTLAFQDAYIKRISFDDGSNYLDDYEEGTKTITVADAASAGNTSSTATMYYTKKGNDVTGHVAFTNIDTTGLTGGNDLFLTGLPFTSSTTGSPSIGNVLWDTVNIDAGRTQVMSYVANNTSYIKLVQCGDNVGFSFIDVDFLTDDASDLIITFSYRTDS